MVVLEIDVDGVFAVESKCKSPVAGHGHRPTPFLRAPEGMKPPTGNVHIAGPGGSIQPVQYPLDASALFGGDPPRRTGGEKPIEPFVTKTPDHSAAMNE